MPEAEEQKPVPPTPRGGVPEELIQKLHEANQRFHKARERVDDAYEEGQEDSLRHRKSAIDQLQETEKPLEEISEELEREIKKSPPKE